MVRNDLHPTAYAKRCTLPFATYVNRIAEQEFIPVANSPSTEEGMSSGEFSGFSAGSSESYSDSEGSSELSYR